MKSLATHTEHEKKLRNENLTKRRRRLRKPILREAVKGSFGNVHLIAERCGVTTNTVRVNLKRWPDINMLFEDESCRFRGLAEDALKQAVERGEKWAIDRVLEKEESVYAPTPRNLVPGTQVNVQNNASLTVSPVEWMQAIRLKKEMDGCSIKISEKVEA